MPAQVRACAQKIDSRKTLFIVSSKSGGTTEPNAFTQYFFDRVAQAIGTDKAGSRFIAITDPASPLQQLADTISSAPSFREYPALAAGIQPYRTLAWVPAALMGIDVQRFLDRSTLMVQACSASAPPEVNPGVTLGTIMGTLAQHVETR